MKVSYYNFIQTIKNKRASVKMDILWIEEYANNAIYMMIYVY